MPSSTRGIKRHTLLTAAVATVALFGSCTSGTCDHLDSAEKRLVAGLPGGLHQQQHSEGSSYREDRYTSDQALDLTADSIAGSLTAEHVSFDRSAVQTLEEVGRSPAPERFLEVTDRLGPGIFGKIEIVGRETGTEVRVSVDKDD